jgi:hypothetical protein
MSIEGGTIMTNDATFKGGGVMNWGSLILTDMSVQGNAAENGGGILNEGGTLAIYSSNIKQNSATFDGGGIHNDALGTVTISGSKVMLNSAESGGGIFNDGGMVTLTDTKVRNNQPDNCVGC